MSPHDEKSLSVLVVEDDADERAATAGLFADAGFDVVAVIDGQEAFEHLLVNERLPNAIVLDLELPLMNGWELLTLVRSYHRFANIAVVIVSAHEMPTVAIATESRTAYCRKPFEPDALLALVRSLAARCEAL